ncbi:MAG: SseB family protein [Bdellovibrionales bacterium]|nr:SseB family protein [Bdellovibrionales bacterium]
MKHSKIDLFLQKVSEGDTEYIEKLCRQLAERLVFIPVYKRENSSLNINDSSPEVSVPLPNSEEKFRVFRIKEPHRRIVPVFTSQKRFKEWSSKQNEELTSISVLGGDICLTLEDKTWLHVDPGNESSVELQPVLVKKIAELESFSEFTDIESTVDSEKPAANVNAKRQKSKSSKDALVSEDLMNLYNQTTPNSPQSSETKEGRGIFGKAIGKIRQKSEKDA